MKVFWLNSLPQNEYTWNHRTRLSKLKYMLTKTIHCKSLKVRLSEGFVSGTEGDNGVLVRLKVTPAQQTIRRQQYAVIRIRVISIIYDILYNFIIVLLILYLRKI